MLCLSRLIIHRSPTTNLLSGRNALWTRETPWPVSLLRTEKCGKHRHSREKRSYHDTRFLPRIHRSASYEFHSLADWLLLYTWFGLYLPEDPWEKLLAIIIVWPLVLGDMLRRILK